MNNHAFFSWNFVKKIADIVKRKRVSPRKWLFTELCGSQRDFTIIQFFQPCFCIFFMYTRAREKLKVSPTKHQNIFVYDIISILILYVSLIVKSRNPTINEQRHFPIGNFEGT